VGYKTREKEKEKTFDNKGRSACIKGRERNGLEKDARQKGGRHKKNCGKMAEACGRRVKERKRPKAKMTRSFIRGDEETRCGEKKGASLDRHGESVLKEKQLVRIKTPEKIRKKRRKMTRS